MSEKVAIVQKMIRLDSAVQTLKEAYSILKKSDLANRKVVKMLAEVCFLLMRYYKNVRNAEEAKRFGRESIRNFEQLGIETLEEAIPFLDWLLPDYVHEDVVRYELKGLSE